MGFICRNTRKLVIALGLLVSAIYAKAQLPDYHIQLFDHTTGIKPGSIRNIVKDQKGFLWILYLREVQRFDGRKTETFKIDGEFSTLFCDNQGRIWVASYDKVLRFHEELRAFREVGLPTIEASAKLPVFQTPDGKIWMHSASGLFPYDEEHDKFGPNPAPIPVQKPYSTRVFNSYGYSEFILHDSWLYRYNMRTRQLDSLTNLNGMVIHPFNEDSVAVTTWDGTSYWYNFQARTIRPVYSPVSLPNEPAAFFSIRSLVEYAPNHFFLASNTGIYEYNNKTSQFKPLKFFYNGRSIATNDYVNSIYLDNQGYAWMGSIDGVARFPYKSHPIGLLRIRQSNDHLPVGIDNVRKLVEDEKGNLWVATGHGFAMWNRLKEDWEVFLPAHDREDRLSFPSIRGLVYDGRYLVLGPTDLGIWLFDTRTHQYRRPGYESEETRETSYRDFIDDIVTLHNGNHLVMGRDAMYVLDGRTYQLRLLDIPAAKENSNYAYQGRDGYVWVATTKGLHCLDSNLHHIEKVKLPEGKKTISAGFMLPDGRLLFSCAGIGLYTVQYVNGISQVKKYSDLLDNVVALSLYQDENGIVWATSEDGIYRLDLKNKKLNLFDYSDNVQGYGFNGNTWLRTKEGNLFFGGVNGINYLRPDLLSPSDEALQVYIQQVRIEQNDSAIYTFDQKATFSYGQRAIEVEFISPYFNNTDKVKYRYKLEGLDDGWKYLGNINKVRFSSLSHGDYRLIVQASVNNADWVMAKNIFTFHIDPPFWLTWWFFSICAVCIGAALGFFIRNRNKKIQDKQDELESEKAITYFATSMDAYQSVDAILWDVARNCIGRLQFEDCVIYLVDEKKKLLVQKAAHGPKSPSEFTIIEPIEIPLGKGITGSVAMSGRAEIIRDTTRDPRYIVDVERRYSEIAVPLIWAGKVIGVIDCEHSKKGFFTQKHLSILITIASLCANKITRVRAVEEKLKAEKVLTDTRQRMAEAEMQALRAQMNPHFIFNCLNSINRYIVKSDQQTASLYLTRFAKLIRLILDNSNSKAVTLTNELEALRLYIEMESIRFEKKFHYTISVDPNIQGDSIYVPPLIIQPYVENAIWHGLLHKEEAGELRISLHKRTPGVLECVIEDNGVGREKARELRSKSASSKKSLGMRLTEDRLALLNAQTQLDASVEVEDLRTTAGSSLGTKVILKIPIDN